ncbi:MAG: TetR/AcrR family transcriptional regulator [Clostridiales bacterium]|nr:TetR/AcrR family transcriptional regulator [Clostridiales bacterium]
MKQQYEQRVLATKRRIYSAFLQLMQEKAIHQISISELCRLADINRSTFYHHFGNQYDVLAELTEDFLAQLEERLQNVSPYDQEGVQRRVELCLDYAMENRTLTLLLMQNAVGTGFAQRLFSLPHIGMLLSEKLSDVASEAERRARISFVTYGSYQLLQEWLTAPDPVGTEEETALILKLARRIC